MSGSEVIQLTLAYDGTDYHGWQHQPDCRTVEGVLCEAMTRLTGAAPVLHGASRTDAGVHALGQSVSIHNPLRIPARNLVSALNGSLPPDVRAVAALERDAGFHGRFSAVAKHYRYTIDTASVPSVLLRRYAHHAPGPLDESLLREASRQFVGTHDFASYQCASGQPRETTVRTIHEVRIHTRGGHCTIDIWGGGFLYKMVRTMVGTLLEVGRGRRPPEFPRQSLEARDRRAAGPTVPACGLCLMEVYYEARTLETAAAAAPI